MERNRSRFTKWFVQSRQSSKLLKRTKSVAPNSSQKTDESSSAQCSAKIKSQSLSRAVSNDLKDEKTDYCHVSNNKQIYSSLQPEIYVSLDSVASEMDVQSSCSMIICQQDLENIRKELIIRTNAVSLAFEILETIFTTSLQYYPENTEKIMLIERIFKDLRCMSNFHHLYQRELNEVVRKDLPLSVVFTNHIINSALNWYKVFYTTFETRSQLISSLYSQDCQFKSIADKAIFLHTQDSSEQHFRNLPWILNSMKDSLFHFEVLLERYSDCLDDPVEKSRINDAIKLIRNILRSCNMQCDYNDFMKTQHEYNLLSPTEPLSPSVRFVHKGIVQKLCHNGTKVRQRMIILFTHMIFITKKSVQFNSIKIKNQFSLSTCNFYILPAEKCLSHKRGFRIENGDFVNEFLIEKDSHFYIWIEKLNLTICQARLRKKSFDRKMNKFYDFENNEEDNHIDLGFEPPINQRRENNNFCNGYKCTKRLSTNQQNNNCSSDGLLYCPECISFFAPLSYCNTSQPVCKECYEIITEPDCRTKAIDRQNTKRRRIQRNGVIKGWLIISKISQVYIDSVETSQKMFCVLNHDCTLYIYESPEDKYHLLPLRLLRATFSTSNTADNCFFNSCVKINKNEFNYILEAESQDETLQWIQIIKQMQLENLEKIS